jgi:hypothetical protein
MLSVWNRAVKKSRPPIKKPGGLETPCLSLPAVFFLSGGALPTA